MVYHIVYIVCLLTVENYFETGAEWAQQFVIIPFRHASCLLFVLVGWESSKRFVGLDHFEEIETLQMLNQSLEILKCEFVLLEILTTINEHITKLINLLLTWSALIFIVVGVSNCREGRYWEPTLCLINGGSDYITPFMSVFYFCHFILPFPLFGWF